MHPKERDYDIVVEVARVNEARLKGEDPYPTFTWEQRLVRAIKDRAGNAERGILVVSNRFNKSHVALINKPQGVEAVWSLSIGDYVFQGRTNLSTSQGDFTSTHAVARHPEMHVQRTLEEYFKPVDGYYTGIYIDPEKPFKIRERGYSRSAVYESPMNTLVQIAEFGHPNPELTKHARIEAQNFTGI